MLPRGRRRQMFSITTFISVNLTCKQRGEKETEKKKKKLGWVLCMVLLFEFRRKWPSGNSGQFGYHFLSFSLIKRNIQTLLSWTLISILPAYHYATNTADVWLPVMSRWFKPRLSCGKRVCKIKRDVQFPLPYCFPVMGWVRYRILLSVSLGQTFQFQPFHQTDVSDDL